MIFETITKRLKKLFASRLPSDINNEMVPIMNSQADPENKKYFFVILYIRNISEITVSLINKSFFTVSLRIINKIDKIVKVQKNQTEYAQKNKCSL